MNQRLFLLFLMHTKESSPLKQQTLLKDNLLLLTGLVVTETKNSQELGTIRKKNEDGKDKGNLDQASKTCFNCIICRATALYSV